MSNEQTNNRDFKGVWIPKHIWLKTELSWMEKLFLVEIDSLDNEKHCFASNSYFADFFQLSKARCTQVIKSLETKGYLTIHLERKGKQVIKRILIINSEKYTEEGSKNSKQGSKNAKQGGKNSKEGGKNSKCNIIIQDNNTSNNIRESENSDYIDFNSLISQGANIGLIGQAKAILQTELNCLTFDDFDNKVIQRMLNSIKSNLKAFKHKKGDYSSVTTKNVIDAFKTSVNAVKNNSKQESISLNYLNSCLTADLYINADKKKVQNDDLSIYQDVVKQTFKHYNRFTAFDKAKLREIIAAIEEAGAEDVYAEFKSLFANLPAYILNSRSYQSVSFVASKINDLMNITSTDAQIKSYHNYTLLKESYGEDRAREMISKILKKKQNEGSKVH